MTDTQKLIKYIAIALAIALIVAIVSGIAGVLGIFTFIFEGDIVDDEMTSYEVSKSITSLDISISAASFTIKTGDSISVESNLKKLKVSEKSSCLTVEEKTKVGYDATGASLTLYVPEGYTFENVDIKTGAGKISLGELSCKKLTLSLGAGDFDAESLTVTDKCKISGGVGEFTLMEGSIADLELEMGVGDMSVSAKLIGNCELTFGVGKTTLNLLGSEEDYRFIIEKGLGSITLNGEKLSASDSSYGKGDTRIEIEGGIGNINITIGE